MPDRVPIPAAELVEWKFQVEHQGFIVRYGVSGGFYFKQSVLHSGVTPSIYSVKLISAHAYDLARRMASLID